MTSGGDVLAWMAIGAGASLAGMIWPFRRGMVGVVVNLLAGIAGAIALGLVSHVLLPSTGGARPLRLLFAALGATVALLVAHAAWNWHVRDRRRSVA